MSHCTNVPMLMYSMWNRYRVERQQKPITPFQALVSPAAKRLGLPRIMQLPLQPKNKAVCNLLSVGGTSLLLDRTIRNVPIPTDLHTMINNW